MGKLELKNIKLRREDFQLDVGEMNVESGSILGIMGKSGCGKSTLLSAVAGFEPLQQGEIFFDGQKISDLPPEKRRVAIVFQKPSLFSHLTVLENVCFGLRIQGASRQQQLERAKYWLEKLEVWKVAKRYPSEISGGEAQRVALARSVVVHFPVLLLDEPFSALDAEIKSQARQLLKQTVKELKLATILVSHDPEDISELADQRCRMDSGKIISWDF